MGKRGSGTRWKMGAEEEIGREAIVWRAIAAVVRNAATTKVCKRRWVRDKGQLGEEVEPAQTVVSEI